MNTNSSEFSSFLFLARNSFYLALARSTVLSNRKRQESLLQNSKVITAVFSLRYFHISELWLVEWCMQKSIRPAMEVWRKCKRQLLSFYKSLQHLRRSRSTNNFQLYSANNPNGLKCCDLLPPFPMITMAYSSSHYIRTDFFPAFFQYFTSFFVRKKIKESKKNARRRFFSRLNNSLAIHCILPTMSWHTYYIWCKN